jgi:hypothetical protein
LSWAPWLVLYFHPNLRRPVGRYSSELYIFKDSHGLFLSCCMRYTCSA